VLALITQLDEERGNGPDYAPIAAFRGTRSHAPELSDPNAILRSTIGSILGAFVSAAIIPLPTPLNGMSTHDLESELLGLAGHIAAAECRFLQLSAEFDDRNGWAGDGIRSCAHWLSWRAGMDLRTASEHLRVAHALPNLPKISEAFAAGRVSYSKVRAITRITGSEPATLSRIAAAIAAGESERRHTTVADPETAERVLLNLALSGTASHVETVVRAVRRRHTPTRGPGSPPTTEPRSSPPSKPWYRHAPPSHTRSHRRRTTWTSGPWSRNRARPWIGSRPAARMHCWPSSGASTRTAARWSSAARRR
jgi:uncharacterized protein DUF222